MSMGRNYWKVVRKVLRKSNVVLEVVDARFAHETRNRELEISSAKADKKLVIVINKADLLPKDKAKKLLEEFSKDEYTVLMSSKERKGKKRLMGFLSMFAKKKDIFVTVIGYPNTGKSSVINYLKGRHSARTSIHAGETRGKQYLRISERIMLVDTPGVLPYFKGGEGRLAVLSAKNPQKMRNRDYAAQKIIEELKAQGAKELFGVPLVGNDFEKILEEIAIKKNRLKQGGEPDVDSMARMIILNWQKGKIRVKTHDVAQSEL